MRSGLKFKVKTSLNYHKDLYCLYIWGCPMIRCSIWPWYSLYFVLFFNRWEKCFAAFSFRLRPNAMLSMKFCHLWLKVSIKSSKYVSGDPIFRAFKISALTSYSKAEICYFFKFWIELRFEYATWNSNPKRIYCARTAILNKRLSYKDFLQNFFFTITYIFWELWDLP